MASSSSLRQNPSNRCVYCWKPATQRCVNCYKASKQQVFYCGKECQRKDWRDAHKHFCALPFPEKKLEKSVYAILLREEATKPEVVEIPSRGYDGYNNIRKFIPDPSSPMYVTTNFYKDNNGNFPKDWSDARHLDNMLLIQYNDNFLNDGSAPNKCIHTLTDNKPPHSWAGPVIVYKVEGRDPACESTCMDNELADGADIVAQFRYYNSDYNNRKAAEFREAFAENLSKRGSKVHYLKL